MGWPGGKKFNKLFFLLLKFGFHDLCADKGKEGWGKGRMRMGVRVMRGRVYVEGDRQLGSGVWQDTMMVWMSMFVLNLLH